MIDQANKWIAFKLSFVFLLVLCVGLISEGCNGGSGQQPVQHFPLTIALSEPLGDAGSPLPDDIKAMLKPFQAKNCSGFLFVPDVTIVRLDVPDAKPEVLDLGKDQNEVERRLGKALSPEKARSVRERALVNQKVSSLTSQPKGTDATTIENLKKLLATTGNQNLFTTERTKQAFGNILNLSKMGTARDLNDLLAKIGSAFCVRAGEKPTPAASLVIYKSGEVVTELPQVASSSATPPNTSTSPSSAPSVSREEADALLNQLSAEAKDAQANPDKKQAVQAKLAKAQSEFTWDYRFSYERAKLAVYGKARHDEAFDHLYRSSEIAIKNGDADRMLQALQNDASGPFHNLTDHAEWQTILNALKTKNSEIVRK